LAYPGNCRSGVLRPNLVGSEDACFTRTHPGVAYFTSFTTGNGRILGGNSGLGLLGRCYNCSVWRVLGGRCLWSRIRDRSNRQEGRRQEVQRAQRINQMAGTSRLNRCCSCFSVLVRTPHRARAMVEYKVQQTVGNRCSRYNNRQRSDRGHYALRAPNCGSRLRPSSATAPFLPSPPVGHNEIKLLFVDSQSIFEDVIQNFVCPRSNCGLRRWIFERVDYG